MSNVLTVEQFQKVLPTQVKNALKPEMVDSINRLFKEPVLREAYRDNLLGYTSVMADGKFKMESYIDAVRYVTFKLMGDSNIKAYVKTFPDRYQKFLAKGTDEKDIASYVTSYNKNKLVYLIYEQSLVPVHVLNADLYQKAINAQALLMTTANSEKVRSDAANSLLTHLKPPETKKIELDIGVKQDSSIDALAAATMKLVASQKARLVDGTVTPQQVAHSKIIEGECETVQ